MDPTRRIANWKAKTTPERSSTDLTARIGTMVPNFKATTNSIVNMEQQVRTVLNASGVPTIQYPFYLNFGREIWALVRTGKAGESLAQEAAVLIAKWVAQGLTSSVLVAIRFQVFSVCAPIVP